MTAIERQRELLAKATAEGKDWRREELGDGAPCVMAGVAMVAHVFNGWKKPADAALIVQAVNDRAALLDVVEAAEAETECDRVEFGATPRCRHAAALRAALDRLHEQPGWER